MHDPRSVPQIDALIDAYIDHSIEDGQFALLCDWLREDAANRKTFARKLALHSEIAEWCIERSGESLAGQLDTDEAEAVLPPIHLDAMALTKQKYAAALSYVIRHTFMPKRVAVLATAAAILLGAVLALVLLSAPDEGEPITEQTPSTIDDPVTESLPVVATLTAEHDAVWDTASAEGALAPGSPLRAGDRLTLTQGFAEITTVDGAVVILQAPATIELLNNDNAIRLHTGKLVGICETESSKGFLVRTPYMDVTDLGTRFGVDATNPRTTEVHVFSGLVQVATHASGTDTAHSQNVSQGQALTIDAGKQIAVNSTNPTRFVLDFANAPYRPLAGSKIRFLDQYPSSLKPGMLESSESAFLILERTGLEVTQAINASTWEPGEFRTFIGDPSRRVPHERVDSYLMHFDPDGADDKVTLTGSITFPRPVIAILGSTQQLANTDALFSPNPGALHRDRFINSLFGLDESDLEINPEVGDFIRLSADRKTIHFQLFAAKAIDEFRVLIQAAESKP